MTVEKMRVLVFLGSPRESTPPRPARLAWWAQAARAQRAVADTTSAFDRAPGQCNAP